MRFATTDFPARAVSLSTVAQAVETGGASSSNAVIGTDPNATSLDTGFAYHGTT